MPKRVSYSHLTYEELSSAIIVAKAAYDSAVDPMTALGGIDECLHMLDLEDERDARLTLRRSVLNGGLRMAEDLRDYMDKFIDAMGRLTGYQVHIDEAKRLERAALPRCGNCYWWMKSRDCPIDDQRRGFPSSAHYPCQKYQAIARVAELLKIAAAEREKAAARLVS